MRELRESLVVQLSTYFWPHSGIKVCVCVFQCVWVWSLVWLWPGSLSEPVGPERDQSPPPGLPDWGPRLGCSLPWRPGPWHVRVHIRRWDDVDVFKGSVGKRVKQKYIKLNNVFRCDPAEGPDSRRAPSPEADEGGPPLRWRGGGRHRVAGPAGAGGAEQPAGSHHAHLAGGAARPGDPETRRRQRHLHLTPGQRRGLVLWEWISTLENLQEDTKIILSFVLWFRRCWWEVQSPRLLQQVGQGTSLQPRRRRLPWQQPVPRRRRRRLLRPVAWTVPRRRAGRV